MRFPPPKAGDRLPDKRLAPIALPDLELYARASGDPNRIHLDETVAKSMGLPGVIAHGMLISGLLAERALELRDLEWPAWRVTRWQIRFRAMAFLGDELTLGAVVKSAAGDSTELDLSAKNQREEIVVTATARLSV